jgi:hypothetical protein
MVKSAKKELVGRNGTRTILRVLEFRKKAVLGPLCIMKSRYSARAAKKRKMQQKARREMTVARHKIAVRST